MRNVGVEQRVKDYVTSERESIAVPPALHSAILRAIDGTPRATVRSRPSPVLAAGLAAGFLILAIGLVIWRAVQPITASPMGSWSAAAPMTTGRSSHTATLLPNGKILVAGGVQPTRVLSDAELYDPTARTWQPAGALISARFGHTATLLGNGKVLVVGGSTEPPGQKPAALDSAELYDPSTNRWSSVASMKVARAFHTATLLPDGSVLVTGGLTSSAGVAPSGQRGRMVAAPVVADAEIYDPVADRWAAAGMMTTPRANHSAVRLLDGRVLVIGGIATLTGWNDFAPMTSAEFYDPAQRRWSSATSMHYARSFESTTLLPDGRVLVAGSVTAPGAAAPEIFDPQTDAWSPVPLPGVYRLAHMAVSLPNGMVLVVGGDNEASAQLYDGRTNTWSSAGTMAVTRAYGTATLLATGRVFIAGGFGDTGSGVGALKSAEVYDPHGSAASVIGRLEATPPSLLLGIVVLLVLGTLTVAFALPWLRRRTRPGPGDQWIGPDDLT